jgi:hypothetical protein
MSYVHRFERDGVLVWRTDVWCIEVLGVAALVGLTTAIYYLGYRDVDKRHVSASPSPSSEWYLSR